MRLGIVAVLASIFLVGIQPVLGQELKRPVSPAERHIPIHPVTDSEMMILKHGDRVAQLEVMGRLMVVHKYRGRSAIARAIPQIKRIWAETEARGGRTEFGAEMVLFMRDMMEIALGPDDVDGALDLVASGQRPVGFFSQLGQRGIRILADSLRSERFRMRSGAAMTLLRIAKEDPAVFKRQTWDLARERLEEALRADPANPDRLAMILALARFGDRGTLDLLAEVAENDPTQLQNGQYINRRAAQRARQELLDFLGMVDGD